MMIRGAAFFVILFLAGCAGNTPGVGAADPSSSAAVTASAEASAAPSAPAEATADPDRTKTPLPKPGAGAVERLTGQVVAGVEPGCLVLTGTGGTHLLIVPGALKTSVEVGDTVTVTGRVKPGMVTTCQQGTPFVVTAVN